MTASPSTVPTVPTRRKTVFLNRKQQQTLSRNNTVPPATPMTSLLCGLTAGVLQAGLFNPYDRALYLSVTQKRPFLHTKNWTHPYAGVFQSLGIRALSGGLYFPVEHWLLAQDLYPLSPAMAGSFTGILTASLVNPLTALKYMTWSTSSSSSSSKKKTAASKQRHRPTTAAKAFTSMSNPQTLLVRGLGATIVRDVVFGGVYTAVRKRLAAEQDPTTILLANCTAAALATVASGPWNYVRNVQYATLVTTPSSTTNNNNNSRNHRSTYAILWRLVQQALEQPTMGRRILYVAARLRIGWGTARVALGMTFGHAVYDGLQRVLLLEE